MNNCSKEIQYYSTQEHFKYQQKKKKEQNILIMDKDLNTDFEDTLQTQYMKLKHHKPKTKSDLIERSQFDKLQTGIVSKSSDAMKTYLFQSTSGTNQNNISLNQFNVFNKRSSLQHSQHGNSLSPDKTNTCDYTFNLIGDVKKVRFQV
ncbi:hypothetical protein pb186bvf_007387 [Paramecium bursaria]